MNNSKDVDVNHIIIELKSETFPTLFGYDIKGRQKEWYIRTIEYKKYSVIEIKYGYVGGKLVVATQNINMGKNIGKKNQTTPFQQATSEAQAKWKKKIEQGFSTKKETNNTINTNVNVNATNVINTNVNVINTNETNINENVINTNTTNVNVINTNTTNVNATNVNVNETNTNANVINVNDINSKTIFPMLAQDYNKHKHKIEYPAYIQPKLDGFRNLYNTTTNKSTTRQGKEFSIIKQSGKLYNELLRLPKGLILDGELYTNKINFEALGVLRKTKKLTKQEQDNLEQIEYHVYDIIDTSLTFEQRNNRIKELHLENYEKIVYVPTILIHSEKQIQDQHFIFLQSGFEGTMIRNKNSFYTIKQRSYDLLKYKDFQDDEFEIIDFTFEKDISGEDKNLIVWIIKVPNLEKNTEFIKCKVRPMGTKEERKQLHEKCEKNFNQFKGHKLWVKYFEKTKDGNLRFPTTKCNSYKQYIRNIIE